LVVSKYALDVKAFSEDKSMCTWKKSSLRKWLNEDFLNIAFSYEEQEYIYPRQIGSGEDESVLGCAEDIDPYPTKDKVFLLSYREAEKYFISDEERVTYCTPYAEMIAQDDPGSLEETKTTLDESCRWILRTNGSNTGVVSCVLEMGNTNHHCSIRSKRMIRPAMWIWYEDIQGDECSQDYTQESDNLLPSGFLEYYLLMEKTQCCPFDGTLLIQEPLEVEQRNGQIKKINFQICRKCKRVYTRKTCSTINLQDYKLIRRVLPTQVPEHELIDYYQLKEKTNICPFDADLLEHDTVTVARIDDVNIKKKIPIQRCTCCKRIFVYKVSSSIQLEMYALNRVEYGD